ncbi:MAG: glycosyltransferase [Bacteroidales bacterium]|nr:glycosyltransferase [Bacteroidales bacterium]
MNVLYVSYDGMTDNLGQSQVIPYLIGLSKCGYSVTILSAEKAEAYNSRKSVIEALLAENNIRWSPIFYTSKPKVISTIKDVWMLKKTARKLHAENKFAIIHCRSYISALVGVYMKRKFKVSFIFDMRGFWADERIEGNIWRKDSIISKILYKYFKKKELQYLQQADYTISLTHTGKEEILSWNVFKDNKPRIEVIPCCADLSLFSRTNLQETVEAVKNKLGIANTKKVVSYLGSLGTWYMLDEMLDFFKVYQQKNTQAVFLFITSDNESFIKNAAQQKNIATTDIIVKKANREQVPEFLSVSDVSVFFVKPVYSKLASSPTKMGEIMAMGIPIVCNDKVGDVTAIVADTMCGVVVSDFTSLDYTKAVDCLETMTFDSSKIIAGSNAYYSLDMGIERYKKVFDYLSAN